MRRLFIACLIGLGLFSSVRANDSARAISPFNPPPPRVPLEWLHPALSEKIRTVLDKPTLSARSQPETINTDHAVYRYLLEHPDQAVKLWQHVGAKVADIEDLGNSHFLWHDGQGSEVRWQIAFRGQGLHIWYAEGKVKPSILFSAQPFRAIAMMQYTEGIDTKGLSAVRHQVHFHVRCEGRAIALAARILGGSAPHLAEQYLGQLQMFYGGMGWYIFQDEARARKLFQDVGLRYPFGQ